MLVGFHRPNSFTSELESLSKQYKDRITLLPLDIEVQSSIDQAAKALMEKHTKIDMLLNVAGILGSHSSSSSSSSSSSFGPERSLDKIDREWLTRTMNVNCIGHVMVTQAMLPLLKKKKEDTNISKIINISARVGSFY